MLASSCNNQNLSYMHDPFIILFKTTNSSTNESLMPVIEYLYPSYSALSTANTAEFTSKIIMRICNLQLQYSDHQPEIS